MTSGGHARSGPPPVPGSGASERKGLRFKSLPAEGYTGEAPEFPLPKQKRYDVFFEDKKRVKEYDPDATQEFRDREIGHWAWAWRTPQAALWATAQWSWVIPAVADWCRLKALSADEDAQVGLWAQIRSREADILLTNDSLNRAGYTVAADDVAAKRDDAAAPTPAIGGSRARLRVAGRDGA